MVRIEMVENHLETDPEASYQATVTHHGQEVARLEVTGLAKDAGWQAMVRALAAQVEG
jgi:hypothetical protein